MYRLGIFALVVLLAGSGYSGSSASKQDFIGLLKVTLSNGSGATAEWVQRTAINQGNLVVAVNGTSAPNDVEITRRSVSFSDDDRNSTRYVYSTFDLTNRTNIHFSNLTFYAVNVPTNIGGTAIASMTAATGVDIASESVARDFQPIHAVRGMRGGFEVNPVLANLQFFTPAEVDNPTDGIKQQAVAQGILTKADTVLQYGFVANDTQGGRAIRPRNLSTDCTDNSCKGYITLAYKFPKIDPRQDNPFSFSLYFVVANTTQSYISQSLDEQAANTAAGLGNTTNFSETRILSGSGFGKGQDNLNNLCQVQTAVPTVTNPTALLMPSTLPAKPGSLDGCFAAGGKRITDNGIFDQANAVAWQRDGKIVVAGYSSVNKGNDFLLVRYNPNGSLDTSFDTDGKVTTDFDSSKDQAKAIALQSDGKIVVAGSRHNGRNFDIALARYTPSGSLDTDFGSGGKVITDFGSSEEVNAIAIQTDGKIMVAGYTATLNHKSLALARYNPDGTQDLKFGGGRGYVGYTFSDGSSEAHAVTIQPDGKILAGGWVETAKETNVYAFGIARMNPDGTLDRSFGTTGYAVTAIGSDDHLNAMALQKDGKIVVAGSSQGQTRDFALVRYDSDGSLDSAFGKGGKVTTDIGSKIDQANAIALQGDGKIVLAGLSAIGNSDIDFAVARYIPDGSLDASFGSLGKRTTPVGPSYDRALALALQDDGKIVAAGFSYNGSGTDFALARYNG